MVQYYCGVSNISTKFGEAVNGTLFLPQCQSTNDVLLELLTENEQVLPEWFSVQTEHQSMGRGQRGNRWESEPGKNITLSFVLYPRYLEARYSFWLSAAISIGLVLALKDLLPNICVKWPNDIFVSGKKLGGILIENQVSGAILEQSVIGIGLNINQIHLPIQATSFALERHQEGNREEVIERIRANLFESVFMLRTEGWEKIRRQYYRFLYKMGQPHDYYLPNGSSFRAVLKGIADNGALILLTASGEKRFQFKEVSFFPTQT